MKTTKIEMFIELKKLSELLSNQIIYLYKYKIKVLKIQLKHLKNQ